MKIRITNINEPLPNSAPLPTSNMEFLVMINNSIVKSPILDVPGVVVILWLSSAFGYGADVLPW